MLDLRPVTNCVQHGPRISYPLGPCCTPIDYSNLRHCELLAVPAEHVERVKALLSELDEKTREDS